MTLYAFVAGIPKSVELVIGQQEASQVRAEIAVGKRDGDWIHALFWDDREERMDVRVEAIVAMWVVDD